MRAMFWPAPRPIMKGAKKMRTTIPFSGFYYSPHDSALDSALESIFSDDSGEKRDSIFYAAQDATDWRMVQNRYAAEYAAAFAAEFKLPLQFESMRSPREYNFSTDVIYCTISDGEAAWLFDTCDKTLLDKIARETFTSRDGFASFCDPDFTNWGDILTWDHNQLGALVRAHVEEKNPDFDSGAEFELMESAQCNGRLDNWIFESNPEALNRLANINDYLNKREGR